MRSCRQMHKEHPTGMLHSDNVDAVKKILTYRIREITGPCPQLPCFQLHQNGRHIPFTEPITSLATLDAAHFVRIDPDYRDSNELSLAMATMGLLRRE